MINNIGVLFQFLIVIALILSLLIISTFLRNIGTKSRLSKKGKELWTDYGMFLTHPTKDFSGEIQVPLELRLFQQPTKCFSCERQLRSQYGLNPNHLYKANPTKCFSCEQEILRLNKSVLNKN
jgi:DNA-directed RNA polymerase subunit N (RpoN/RPB10)